MKVVQKVLSLTHNLYMNYNYEKINLDFIRCGCVLPQQIYLTMLFFLGRSLNLLNDLGVYIYIYIYIYIYMYV